MERNCDFLATIGRGTPAYRQSEATDWKFEIRLRAAFVWVTRTVDVETVMAVTLGSDSLCALMFGGTARTPRLPAAPQIDQDLPQMRSPVKSVFKARGFARRDQPTSRPCRCKNHEPFLCRPTRERTKRPTRCKKFLSNVTASRFECSR